MLSNTKQCWTQNAVIQRQIIFLYFKNSLESFLSVLIFCFGEKVYNTTQKYLNFTLFTHNLFIPAS